MSLTSSHYTGYAIVTDGLWRKSLSVIRSLGKAGFHVCVMGDSNCTIGFWSTFCKKRVIAKTASQNKDSFGASLLELLEEYKSEGIKPVLFPMEDPTMSWVSENRSKLEKLSSFLIPDKESLALAADKSLTMEHARQQNTPHPKTWNTKNAEDVVKIIEQLDSFVIKPKVGVGSSGIVYSEKRSLHDWQEHIISFGELIIQERIPAEGRAIGASFIMDSNGEELGHLVHERIQQYPNSGGPSTDRVVIEHPDIVSMSRELLKSLRWKGVAMVEWKIDPRGDQPKLLEINPRFWGSLELAVRGGVDFPLLYAFSSMSEPSSIHSEPRIGTRCRWMIPGDILRYLTDPKRESLFAFLKGLPQLAEEWDSKDLRGFLAVFICTFMLACNPRYWKFVRRG